MKRFLVPAAASLALVGCNQAENGPFSLNVTNANGVVAAQTQQGSCPDGYLQSASALETVTVPTQLVNGVTTSAALAAGAPYVLVASGTYTNSQNVADAEYISKDNWATSADGYNVAPWILGEGSFDLQVDQSFVNWGEYNDAHVYSLPYTGTGDVAGFRIFDGDANTGVQNTGWYGDNSGSLTVDVYACELAPVPEPEPAPAPSQSSTVPSNQDQCKKDGWKSLTDHLGNTFKNQGDCVSYVATKGKNLGAGTETPAAGKGKK